MNGQGVMRFATKAFTEAVYAVVNKVNISINDIKLIIPHQANLRILKAAAKKMNIDENKFYINIDKTANTSVATIPIALYEALNKNVINRGDIILFVAFGAGLSSGGGSIKKIGLYDEMIKILNDNKISYVEFSGVEPNPRIETVRDGIKICRENNIDVVLAVGGGSTIDCAKVIAAGVKYDGYTWDLVTNPEKIEEVLPIVTILTLSATGSEMNKNAAVSDMTTNQKLGTGHENMRTKASILDPEYTY